MQAHIQVLKHVDGMRDLGKLFHSDFCRSGNAKLKGIAKVPLKRPVRADLGNASLPESCQELAVAHSAGCSTVVTT